MPVKRKVANMPRTVRAQVRELLPGGDALFFRFDEVASEHSLRQTASVEGCSVQKDKGGFWVFRPAERIVGPRHTHNGNKGAH